MAKAIAINQQMRKHNIRLSDGTIQSIIADYGTGITDISGQEIFEYDVCFIHNHGIGIVQYNHYTGKFQIGGIVFDNLSCLDIKVLGSVKQYFNEYHVYISSSIILHISPKLIRNFFNADDIEVWKQINETTFSQTTLTKFKKLIQKYEQQMTQAKIELDKMNII